MKKSIAIILLVIYCSCKTTHESGTEKNHPAAITPGTCNIKGQIITTLPPEDPDSSAICAKYACRARVKILEVYGCGSSVTLPVNSGDTMVMKFAYTLHSTEIIPNMPAHFPGLKNGDIFYAAVHQRMVMGTSGEFTVYDYELKK